jgi:hypothetical protein
MRGRREGLPLLGARLEAPGFDRADRALVEAETGAMDDLDILGHAVFVYHQAHRNRGVHTGAAGLFAVLRLGSGDHARRPRAPTLGKQQSGCKGDDEAECWGHAPPSGKPRSQYKARGDGVPPALPNGSR